MKRNLFLAGILGAALVFGLILSGCPTEAEDDTPSGKLGDKAITLSGTVYEEKTDFTTLTITQEKFTTADKVEATVGSKNYAPVDLTDGKFSITLEIPGAAEFSGTYTNSVAGTYYFYNYTGVTVEPLDAKYADVTLALVTKGESIDRSESKLSGSSTSYKSSWQRVEYLYVDKAITITLKGKEGTGTLISGSPTTKDTTLKLAKGWNAIYYKGSGSVSTSGIKNSSSVSVAAPKLKWTF